MKKLIGILLIIILCMMFSYAQESGEPEDVAVMNKINQEHSNTRKYFSDELTRQRNEFFKMMDDRATYYENTVDDMLTTAVWKLGLLWGGIVFFIVAFNNLVRNRLEKKRFKKLKESLKGEVLRDMMLQQQGELKQQVQKPVMQTKQGVQVETDELFRADKIIPPPPAPVIPKKSWSEKRKEKVAKKRMEKLQKIYNKKMAQNQRAMEMLKMEEMKIKQRAGIPVEQPPQQPIPQQVQPQSSQQPPINQKPPVQEAEPENKKKKPTVEYSNTFEVEY